MKKLIISLTLSLSLISLSLASAEELKLSASDKKELENYNILVTMQNRPASSIKLGQATGIVKARPEEVWQVITDYQNYPHFMPRTLEAKVLKRTKDYTNFYSKLNMPWPIDDVSYVITLKEEKKKWSISWQMQMGSGKGVKDTYGSWKLIAWQKGRTLAIYQLYFQPASDAIPSFLTNGVTRKTLRSVIRAVRKRTKIGKK